jgi:hypothetical protein
VRYCAADAFLTFFGDRTLPDRGCPGCSGGPERSVIHGRHRTLPHRASALSRSACLAAGVSHGGPARASGSRFRQQPRSTDIPPASTSRETGGPQPRLLSLVHGGACQQGRPLLLRNSCAATAHQRTRSARTSGLGAPEPPAITDHNPDTSPGTRMLTPASRPGPLESALGRRPGRMAAFAGEQFSDVFRPEPWRTACQGSGAVPKRAVRVTGCAPKQSAADGVKGMPGRL